MFPAILYCTKNGKIIENPGNIKEIPYKLELVKSSLKEEEQFKLYTLLKMLGTDNIVTILGDSEDILVAYWYSWKKNPMKSHYKKYEVFNKILYEQWGKDLDVGLSHYKVIGRHVPNPKYFESLEKRKKTMNKYIKCITDSNFLLRISKNNVTIDEEYLLDKIKQECKKYNIGLSEYVQISLGKRIKNE